MSGRWKIGDTQFEAQTSWRRKPDVHKPNPIPEASFGTSWDDAEWVQWNAGDWLEWGFPWGHWKKGVVQDIGKHYMIEPTFYKSTVSSMVYKVSDGYSMEEEIRGMKTGTTTVGVFLSNIIKADEGQTLTVKSGADGLGLSDAAVLSDQDILLVMSADSANFTQYTLGVSEQGLNPDAVLTSAMYDIAIESNPAGAAGVGSVSGFEYGTRLATLINNINVPEGATMSVVNSAGAYIPLKKQNFDTVYVDVTVNSDTYFDVVAEDGLTSITYQLLPSSSLNDAFVLSDVYKVVQGTNLIHFVPRGTYAQTLLSNLVPATGATMKVVDKMGFERTEGGIYEDDKVVVTSGNGSVTRVYHLSMLPTLYIPEATYLAYVLSNVYAVDQVGYVIGGPSASTPLTDFYSKITPAMGATAVVVDIDGNERTSGDLNDGDMLKVTSQDGRIVVMYNLDIDITSADKLAEGRIQVYPNPTSGQVNIQGLEQGTRIQVFNQTGAMIRDVKTSRTLETISLDNQSAGMYLVVLTKDSRLLGQYKVIRR